MSNDDPYALVALVYAGFDCEKCGAYFCTDGSEEEMGQAAKDAGWSVVPAWIEVMNCDDFHIHCPECKGKQ